MTTGTFSDVFSLYYGRNFWWGSLSYKVTQMVKDIKEVYRERMLKNEWLSEETKQKGSQEAGYHETLYRLSWKSSRSD